MKGVYGLKTMDHLQFKNSTPYRNAETIKHFGFRRGPEAQEAEAVSFWMAWWRAHPEWGP